MRISNDRVGMLARDYDALLSTVLASSVNNLNIEWTRPLDIQSLDPVLPYVAMMLPKFQVTPFLEDEFFFIGFSFLLDSEAEPNFERIDDAYGDVLTELIDQVGHAKDIIFE